MGHKPAAFLQLTMLAKTQTLRKSAYSPKALTRCAALRLPGMRQYFPAYRDAEKPFI
jgi:hypothetical protein